MRKGKRSSRDSIVHPSSPDQATSTWRVFCAIEMPDAVRTLVARHIQQLQSQLPDVAASWSRQEKIHLTLKFLGSIPGDRVEDISQAADLTIKAFAPFPIVLGGSGTFPKNGPPRVLWIGINDSTGRLQELHQQLEDECSRLGFEPEERPFNPHLTIARLRMPRGPRELARAHLDLGFPSVEVLIRELSVYRSELGSGGSKYSVISTHKLSESLES
ncbi:MAG TPA: RNA 2',3'-cyclic phosphodiesterase [Pyrinomonadaceae bacterium]|nr:RNA 2',3'-cyclic phosphodiesterase [Pyrinomonadaceae bacterium]